MKSYYVLEISVIPGGARKGWFFVYNHLEPIQRLLEIDLELDFKEQVGLLYGYGESINLLTYIDGEEVQRINLLPYITVSGPEGITFALDEEANPLGVDRAKVCDESFLSQASAQVNWDAVSVKPLTGDLLQPGEIIEVLIYPDSDPESLEYGVNDLEIGESPDEFWATLEKFGFDITGLKTEG